MANILITGASGYLGGSLLHDLRAASDPLPVHGQIYALVRNDDQAAKVKELYETLPLTLDLSNQDEITTKLLEKEISIVFFLIDAMRSDSQLKFIKALAVVGQRLSVQTHFLHTSGAKLFSSFVGHPTDHIITDADDDLFSIQKSARGKFPPLNGAVETNNTIIEAGIAASVKTYIFMPCIVYGKGTGFGNKISIQTVAIVRAAKALRAVHKPDNTNGTWPVAHVHDNSTLYIELLRKILSGDDIPNGQHGYYLASPGSVPWTDIYSGVAISMSKRGLVDKAEVLGVDEQALEKAAETLGGGKEFVSVHMGGKCTLEARNGYKIGWKPQYAPRHITEAMDDEVDLILQNI